MKLPKLKDKLYLYLSLVLIAVFIIYIKNPIIIFIYTTVLWLFILMYAKISFFTELSFILLFSYLQGVIHKLTGGISGSTLAWAGVKMPFYFDELSVAIVSFMITLLGFVWFTKLIEREKNIYNVDLKIDDFTGMVFVIFALILVLLIFPSLPTLSFAKGARARNESLPYGFILIALILCCLSFDNSRKHKWYYFIYTFIVFWVFGHGERVEILGFLSYLALKILNKVDFSRVKKHIRNKKKIYVGAAAVAFIIVAIWIGLKRSGAYTNITLELILYNLFVQPTCGDIVYCFNCATNMWKQGNGLYGYTYIDYLLQLLPGSTSDFSPANILLSKYNTMGGALFFSEPMMNFGILGVFLSNIEFCIVMNLVLKKISKYRAWFWIPIVIEVFRICWYGRSGWILTAFVEIPILFLFTKYILNKIKIKS